jgi:hypothetical protein
MTSNSWITFLTAAGAVIIFISWISENYFQKKWESQKDESDFIRQLGGTFDIILYTINSNILLYRYWYEKNENDSEAKQNLLQSLLHYLVYRYKLSTLLSNQLAIGDKTYSDTYLQEEQAKMHVLFDNLIKLVEKEDLVELFNIYYKEEHRDDERVIQANKYRSDLNKKENFYNRFFLSSYVIGSLFLALAFVVNCTKQ